MRGQAGGNANAGALAYKWIVLINTTLGVLMSSIDGSIVTISLPDITRTIHASVVEGMWVLIGYQLVTCTFLLPFARLADMKGRVRLYNLGFAIFTISSALCGLSQSGTQLVVFRLIQGIGAALLFSNSTALVTDAFPSWQRGFALSINMTAATTGFIVGTLLGGTITEYLGWRYVFFINVPVGAFATAWAFLQLHEIVEPERKARFDLGGMITFPLGISSILAGLTLVVTGHAGDLLTSSLFVVGIAALVAFLFVERWVSFPMMDLSLFRIRLFWAGNTTLLLNSLSRGSTLFIMSWYFQAVLKDPPFVAGLKILPMVLPMMILSPIAGRLSDQIGSRLLSTLGLICTFLAQAAMTTFAVNVPYPTFAIGLAVLGAGSGLFNSPNTSAVMGSVPSNRRGVAAGTRTLLMNTGQTMAIAIAMVILSTVMSYQLLAALFVGTATGGQGLNGVVFMRGLHELFLFGAAINVIAILCSVLRGTEYKPGGPDSEAQEAEPVGVFVGEM